MSLKSLSQLIYKIKSQLLSKVDGTPGVKVYRAIVEQSSTNAPVMTVLENSIGPIEWARDTEGVYEGTLAGAFTADKTVGRVVTGSTSSQTFGLFNRASANVVSITIQDVGQSSAEWGTEDGFIEILVYP